MENPKWWNLYLQKRLPPLREGKIEVTLFTTSGGELLGKQNSLK
jgi:hypothetical protein